MHFGEVFAQILVVCVVLELGFPIPCTFPRPTYMCAEHVGTLVLAHLPIFAGESKFERTVAGEEQFHASLQRGAGGVYFLLYEPRKKHT